MGLTKAQLEALNDSSFPNNNSGLITPEILRTYNDAVITNTVNQDVYSTDSASFDSRINAITASGGVPSGTVSSSAQIVGLGFATTASVNSLSASIYTTDSTQTNLINGKLDTSSFNTFSTSVDSRLDGLEFKDGTFVTTASFNTFSASVVSEITEIESFTASVSTSVGLLQTFSGSQYKTDSASFDSRILAITASGGIPAGTVSSSVQILDYGIFATTGSNTFVGNQLINGNVNITGSLTASGLKYPTTDNGEKSFIQTDGAGNLSLQYVDTIFEAFYAGESVLKGTPLYFSGSQGANPIAYVADASNPNKMPVIVVANENLTAGTTYEGVVLGLIEGIDLTGYTAGQTVYVAEGGGWSTSLPSGSNSITQVLGVVTKGGSGGKGLVLNPGPAQLPGLVEGYLWVGNSSNQPVAVATSSFIEDLSGYTTTASFNSYTASQDFKNTTFATTGSNTFVGNQIIEGNVYISSSTQNDLIVNGQVFISSSATAGTTAPQITVSGSAGQTSIRRNNIVTRNTTHNGGLYPSTIFANNLTTLDEIGITVEPSVFAVTGWTTGPAIYVNNTAGDTYPAVFGFQNKTNYTDGRVTVLTPLSASAGITSSNAFINGELYSVTSASFDSRINSAGGQLQIQDEGTIQGNATSLNFIGDGVSVSVTSNTASVTISGGGSIDTSSFATTGSNTFIGNQTITGNVYISSSTQNDVVVNGQVFISSSATAASTAPRLTISGSAGQTIINRNSLSTRNTTDLVNIQPATIFIDDLATSDEIAISVDPTTAGFSGWTTGPAISINNPGDTYPSIIGFQNKANYTDGRVTVLTPLQVNSDITASTILVTGTGTTAIQYNQQSTGSVAGQFATSYGKDNLKVYQYQGQAYAFNVNLTANQANAYTGSQFEWGLQLNGNNVSLPGGGGTYFAMVSGSTTGSGGGGEDKKGLNYLGTAMILDNYADASFRRKVYVDQGMFVSQSVGGSQVAALTVDGTNAENNRAIVATGSVSITGSLTVNGTAVGAIGYGSYYTTTTNSGSVLTFLTEESAVGFENVSGSYIRTTQSGVFQVTANVSITSTDTIGTATISLKKNGSVITATEFGSYFTNANSTNSATTDAIVSLNANDYIEVGLGLLTNDTATAGRISIVKIA